MSERQDLELRVYVTGRPDGTIEWSVTTFEPDGQVAWIDGDVSPWKNGGAITPRQLSQTVTKTLRHLCFILRG